MFRLKPDYAETKQRIEAFWEREIIDRPVVQFSLAKRPEEWVPLPPSGHATSEARWLDAQYQTELAVATLQNQEFLGDTLPVAWPNLGPEIFSAFYGCPIHFGDYGTSWSDPILEDWEHADELRLDWDSPYLRQLHVMTDLLLEAGEGLFITGMTDWHVGADCVAAFRDPQNLAMDMLLYPEEVRRLLARLEAEGAVAPTAQTLALFARLARDFKLLDLGKPDPEAERAARLGAVQRAIRRRMRRDEAKDESPDTADDWDPEYLRDPRAWNRRERANARAMLNRDLDAP